MKWIYTLIGLGFALSSYSQSLIAFWDFENVASRPSAPILASSKANQVSTAYAVMSGGTSIGSPDVCGGNETWATNFWTTSSSMSSSDYFRFDASNGTDDFVLHVNLITFRASVSSDNAADQFDVFVQTTGAKKRIARDVPVSTSCGTHSFSVTEEIPPDGRIRVYVHPYGQNAGAQAATLRIDDVAIRGFSLLPVQWRSVAVRSVRRGIEVHWSTATETNNAYFTVERSADGRAFQPISRQLTGIGTGGYTYRLLDEHPLPGQAYYRIRQTDHDGQSTVSRIVGIRWSGHGTAPVRIYPQPARYQLTIESYSDDAPLNISVYDSRGALRLEEELTGTRSFPVSDWPPGTYVLRLAQAGKVWVHRVVKL